MWIVTEDICQLLANSRCNAPDARGEPLKERKKKPTHKSGLPGQIPGEIKFITDYWNKLLHLEQKGGRFQHTNSNRNNFGDSLVIT